jgi:succinate-acetate transporter protein
MTDHSKSNWANPSPAGTISLGFAIMIFFALLTGKVPSEGHMVAGLWLLGAFVTQLCVALIELNMGNDVGGNIYLWFGSFFCLATGMVFIWEYFAHINGWPTDLSLQGYLWIAIWLVMWLNWPIFVSKFPLTLGVTFSIMNICSPGMALMNLGVIPASVFSPVIGWMMLAASILALYSGSSMITNKSLGKQLFPLGPPLIGRQKRHGLKGAVRSG